MQSESDVAMARDAQYSAWEFVHCSVCYLPFINPRNPNAPPIIPFWLAECTHVVCNNHLNVDRTCRQCNDGKRIELMPLQLDLPEPMSRWFQPLPDALLDLVGASKFQHETMANLLRFYKKKSARQNEIIEKLKSEVDTLRAQAIQTTQEREAMGVTYNDMGHELVGGSGKRRKIDAGVSGFPAAENTFHQQHESPSSNYGTSRLTLRPGSARAEQVQGHSHHASTSVNQPMFRQGARSEHLSLEEFAYQPPDYEDRRMGTARASMSSSDAMISNPSTYWPIAASTKHYVGTSQLDRTPNPTATAPVGIYKSSSSIQNGRVEERLHQSSATRQRFNPSPISTSMSHIHFNSGSTHPEMAPIRNEAKPSGAIPLAGSKRFVPATPSRQNLNQMSVNGGQQQRTRSQLQMPPPPPPNGNRFR